MGHAEGLGPRADLWLFLFSVLYFLFYFLFPNFKLGLNSNFELPINVIQTSSQFKSTNQNLSMDAKFLLLLYLLLTVISVSKYNIDEGGIHSNK
jgi:hypothetical protein